MPAEFIAPSGIRDGEPQALAELCAAGGSAVVAYCEAAGARPRVAEAAIRALATFRYRVAGDVDLAPEQLGLLLLSVTRDAALREGGAGVTRESMEAADASFGIAPPARLAPGLARDMIGAIVAAAPVSAADGDGVALCDAIEERYTRIFEQAGAPREEPAAAQVSSAGSGVNSWVPADLQTPGTSGAETASSTPGSRWRPEGLEARSHIEPAPTAPVPLGYASAPETAGPADRMEPYEDDDEDHAAPFSGLRRLKVARPRLPRPRRRSPPPGGAPSRDPRPLVVGAIAAVAVAVAALVISAPEPAVEQGVIQVRPLDTPFEAAGAVFEAARTRTAQWAITLRQREPREGRKWITLAVHTRNAARANFHPRALGYRLRLSSGLVVGPDTATVPDALFDAGGRLLKGRRASVHLGFQVPQPKTEFSLEFDPGPGSPRIRVPLN